VTLYVRINSSPDRLVALADGYVSFRWRDSASWQQEGIMTAFERIDYSFYDD
jgi:hypothetical protein